MNNSSKGLESPSGIDLDPTDSIPDPASDSESEGLPEGVGLSPPRKQKGPFLGPNQHSLGTHQLRPTSITGSGPGEAPPHAARARAASGRRSASRSPGAVARRAPRAARGGSLWVGRAERGEGPTERHRFCTLADLRDPSRSVHMRMARRRALARHGACSMARRGHAWHIAGHDRVVGFGAFFSSQPFICEQSVRAPPRWSSYIFAIYPSHLTIYLSECTRCPASRCGIA